MRNLHAIVPGHIWAVRSELTMPGGIVFPLRMTLVRLKTGALWIHSPIEIDAALADDIRALGDVAYIIAPNAFHHLHIASAILHFPTARVYGAKGLDEKRSEIQWDEILDDSLEGLPWSDELKGLRVEGCPQMNEVLFFHEETQTLLVTDLLFNNLTPKGWRTRWMMRIAGTYKKYAQSRMWKWIFCPDPKAAGTSLQGLLQWDFKRVIMCHGDVVEGSSVREDTLHALRWMLGSAKRKQLTQNAA